MSREMWNWDLLQLWGYIVKTIHVPDNWSMIDKTTVEPKAKDRFKNPAVVVLSWIEAKLYISLQFQCLGQVDNDIMCIFFDFSKLHKKSMSIFVPWACEVKGRPCFMHAFMQAVPHIYEHFHTEGAWIRAYNAYINANMYSKKIDSSAILKSNCVPACLSKSTAS